MGVIHDWGSTPEERAEAFPCDRYGSASFQSCFRAVDVSAPVDVTFRWLCQLRVAPYSYDWIDNFGRRSPRRRDPANEQLEVGQRWMTIFRLLEFEVNRQLTLVIDRTKVFGDVFVSYTVRPTASGSRIVVKLNVRLGERSPMRWILLPGDLIMMRKQLLTLKELAESEYAKAA
ncbi:MAG TPA: hypothetical protein VFG30_19370 [Polyangiales bacterium]|jgi:hypothetical protein|nr:hypothetical protein [Polyangiales bacterium]